MPCSPLPAADLEHILASTAPLWHELQGARLFITGGTGFWGRWLLESIKSANEKLGAKLMVTVLSRDPNRFRAAMPHLRDRDEFDWLSGETANFRFPCGHYDFVFHLATASAAELRAAHPALAIATLVGTQRVIDFARMCGAQRLLLASSGAVYGRQPADMFRIPEDYGGGPNPQDAASAYGEVKRLSELFCAASPDLECIIARGFSFVGPHLPLTDKFAVGGFFRDAIAGGPILIHGDGRPSRAYLYAADLVIWLLVLLLRGKPNRPYNVGSDQAVCLADLATEIALAAECPEIKILGLRTTESCDRYTPEISRARDELGLTVLIPRPEALARTLAWIRQAQ
ncbi:MAG: NAD(P)-dependent oxidoreductase [Rhodobacteraceae bacterium]|uniref:NAD-dependent epimerase/dehydratase family protein n=1 Tax=Accumulibacter sp. TaxID=2053492 RepID=UPI0019E69A86|nr:NAD(P)-dependent oxidoreductase [Accumulibacter sp.]MBE2258448.1 NAD(P)-dependent oxidoreductase [Paracoccaceae bacterium]MCB1943562.1 NAD(P)-dependent oxidoreductase [Accumulibacter sp.]